MKYIAIHGNIGAGKSTLIEELKKQHERYSKHPFYPDYNDIVIVQEPVDMWKNCVNVDGIDKVKEYYNDLSKCFGFELLALATRAANVNKICDIPLGCSECYENSFDDDGSYDSCLIKPTDDRIIIFERDPLTCVKIFAKRSQKLGLLSDSEYEMLENLANIKFQPTHYLWIDTDVETCKQRQKDRDGFEIDEQILIDLDQSHREMFENGKNVIRYDPNEGSEKLFKHLVFL